MAKDKKKILKKPIKTQIQNVVEDAEDVAESIQEGSNEICQNEAVEFIPTGITLYDLVLGGGYAQGKIVNVVGDNSTGKTLLTLEFLSSARKFLKDKFSVFYDDAESGFSFDCKKMYGFEPIREDQDNSTTMEKWLEQMDRELMDTPKKKVPIYVLDSLDALSDSEEIEQNEERIATIRRGKEYTKGTFGGSKPKKLGSNLRTLNNPIKEKNMILIIISQVRENIGVMYGPKFRRAGGKALDFYASQIVWLAVAEKMEKFDRTYGVRLKVKNTKNKVGKPFRTCYIDVLFDYGVDNITSNINFLYDLLTDLGKSKDKKSDVEWDGKQYSVKELIAHIEKESLEDELAKRVIKKWNDIEEKVTSKRKSKW
ncbi:MAG: ATPase domain-containing protein [Candidatus Pacearchaeota archaeon]|jgi:recombination protein RecA